MNKNKQNDVILDFFKRYQKWFSLYFNYQIISTIIVVVIFFLAGVRYCADQNIQNSIIENDSGNSHLYVSELQSGYMSGVKDGAKDYNAPVREGRRNNSNFFYLKGTPWAMYQKETEALEMRALAEKDEYIAQFPPEQWGEKLAEIKLKNIKMPSEKMLKNRYKKRINFYIDYVDKKIQRSSYSSEDEYIKFLQEEAWKLGYEYGYSEGRATKHPSEKL
jgi:hypothetical protein